MTMMYISITEPTVTQIIHSVHYIILQVYSECCSWLWKIQNVFKICTASSFTAPTNAIRSAGNHSHQVFVWFFLSHFCFISCFLVFGNAKWEPKEVWERTCKSGSLQRDVQVLEYFRIWISIRKEKVIPPMLLWALANLTVSAVRLPCMVVIRKGHEYFP